MRSNLGNKEIFAKNLSYYVGRSGRDQKEIAEAIGVAPSTFNEWIKAKKYPRMDKVEMLASYFGILKSDLIEDKSEENSNTNTGVNNGIIGNHNSHNVVGLDANGEIEKEILNICKKLDIKRKNALLTRAYELLEGQ